MNESKKIEPTDAMVDEAANTLSLYATGTSLRFHADEVKCDYRNRVLPALRAALNHPDAPGLFVGEDDRPWEPLNGLPRVGDEVRQERPGLTITGVVGRVDEEGDPWTAEDIFIGEVNHGTWYVRRPAQPLPPERDGVVLVPADGHEAITTADGQAFSRLTFTMKQGIWYGPNLAQLGEFIIQTTSPSRLTPDTWKVEEK